MTTPSVSLPLTREAFTSFRRWIVDDALPLWENAGWDNVQGQFHERLTLEGRPIDNCDRRAMVQARQIYAYTQAHLLGWADGREKASIALENLITRYKSADGQPGYVHSLRPDGSIANASRDTYAHAFVLFALGWYFSLTKDSQALAEADIVLGFLDEKIADSRGGYKEKMPEDSDVRGQNIHMHLFEALIVLHRASGEPRYLARAGEIFGLFSGHFFDAQSGSLIEFLDNGLVPLPNGRGLIREPGHHYEWVWLLHHFERVSGRHTGFYSSALYEHAHRFGWDNSGFIVDQVNADGSIALNSRRCWPHTECIKANMVEAETGRPGADQEAAHAIGKLTGVFFTQCVRGGWRDHLDVNNQLKVNFMPSSSLYHILCAAAEVERVLLIEGIQCIDTSRNLVLGQHLSTGQQNYREVGQ